MNVPQSEAPSSVFAPALHDLAWHAAAASADAAAAYLHQLPPRRPQHTQNHGQPPPPHARYGQPQGDDRERDEGQQLLRADHPRQPQPCEPEEEEDSEGEEGQDHRSQHQSQSYRSHSEGTTLEDPEYVPRSEYNRVCEERDRYLAALKRIAGFSLEALDLPDITRPSARAAGGSRKRSLSLSDHTLGERWALTRVSGPPLLPGNAPDIQVYRVDRGADIQHNRFLFRGKDALELLSVPDDQLATCGRRVDNIIQQRSIVKAAVVREPVQVTAMLRRLNRGDSSLAPKGFRNTGTNLLTFDGLVQLTADLYCSHILGGSTLTGAGDSNEGLQPNQRQVHQAAVEAAMAPALEWMVDTQTQPVPQKDWTQPRR